MEMTRAIMTRDDQLLLELMQVAVGTRDSLSIIPSSEEWERLFIQSQKQSVAGVAVTALDKLSNTGVRLPTDLILDWIGLGEQIKRQNILVNKRCVEVCQMLAEKGFRSCILKGQGNARMYPNPYYRTPGDIDVWIEGNRDEIKSYVLSLFPKAHDGIMHIDFPIFDDVSVEIHYSPRHSIVPKYNKRLIFWLNELSEEQFSHKVNLTPLSKEKVAVPTTRFNVVHQMSHMMGHTLAEGIGIRHLLDYFFVLKALHEEGQKDDYEYLFNYLGMLQYAKGIMWIEEMFGLDREMIIVPPSEKVGRIILEDILEGGNFGRYRKVNSIREKSILLRGLIDTKRLLRIYSVQPSQAIWRLAHKLGNIDSARKLLFD